MSAQLDVPFLANIFQELMAVLKDSKKAILPENENKFCARAADILLSDIMKLSKIAWDCSNGGWIEIRGRWQDIRRKVEMASRRFNLLSPLGQKYFEADLRRWVIECGLRQDQNIIRQLKKDPLYPSEAINRLFEMAEKRIGERVGESDNGVDISFDMSVLINILEELKDVFKESGKAILPENEDKFCDRAADILLSDIMGLSKIARDCSNGGWIEIRGRWDYIKKILEIEQPISPKIWGEVSLKVKRAILIAKKFTVSQIVDITGIKYQSVETVIQRLLKEGALIKVNSDNLVSPEGTTTKKGRPKQYYTFANPEKTKMLRDNLDALLQEQSLVEPSRHKPKNPHFMKALSTIDSLEASCSEITDNLLNEIDINLSLAREYEEMVDENNEIAMAYIDFAQARLEYLREEREEGEKLLENAKNVFKKYKMPEEQSIDEYLISSKLSLAIKETKKAIKNENYEILAHKLNSLTSDFASYSILPSITSRIKEFIETACQLSNLTGDLLGKNRRLEEQIQSLLEENEKLKIQQQLSSEINRNLSEAVKNYSLIPEARYPQHELPKPSLFGEGEPLRLPEKVLTLSEFSLRNKRKAVN
ncbi:MAG: hypothetical protein A3G93_02955 [Nitrospinae bacterium RIFCSPLOWO2_12_FULL_45_22]|nr:MAG: hypothetical protein A3G93_02955 [Nitrospinae bacterium RIFCSPLOWO2_12_FULL_45_22]